MEKRSDGLALLGRALLCVLFIVAGWGKIGGFAGTVGYIGSKGLPLPQVLAALAIVVELGGGLLLLIGWKARWIAWAMAVFTVIITPIFHGFWNVPAAEAMGQQVHFLKNVAIIGGLLMVAAMGPGRYSVDRG